MQKQSLTYDVLFTSFRKGRRNGNWRELGFLDKILYRASLWYAKHHGRIGNGMLGEKLLGFIEKLTETSGMRIFKRGLDKAVAILEKSEEEGLLRWAPSLRVWLRDPNYIFWLGAVRF